MKSHQDDKKDFEKLSFAAQLNVLADKQATKQLKTQEEVANERTMTNPLPTRGLPIAISYGGQIISSHYVTRLREAICTDDHKEFLLIKYNWSPHVASQIAWEAFSTCARRLNTTEGTTRSKLVHNWLNLGAQRATFHTGDDALVHSSQGCPYCNEPEDFHHLLTCTEPRALKSRYEAAVVLNKHMSQGGPGPQALYQAIREWTLHSEAPVTAQAQTLASQPQVDIALASQSRIGWLNVFRGFLSLDWGYFYSRDDQTPEDIRRPNATKILSQVVLAVHNYSVSIWKSRNAVLHEAENSIGSNIINSNLNNSITQLYMISETLSPILQSYFTIPLADRLTTTVRQRKR